jgi:hypothetical protein
MTHKCHPAVFFDGPEEYSTRPMWSGIYFSGR